MRERTTRGGSLDTHEYDQYYEIRLENRWTHIEYRKPIQDETKILTGGVLGGLDPAHVKTSGSFGSFVDNLSTVYDSAWGGVENFRSYRGAFRWVSESATSRRLFAVGTGTVVVSLLVDIIGRDHDVFPHLVTEKCLHLSRGPCRVEEECPVVYVGVWSWLRMILSALEVEDVRRGEERCWLVVSAWAPGALTPFL